MTRIWHADQLFDSIREARKYEFRREYGANPIYHPRPDGAIYHERDFDIHQTWGPVLPHELKPIHDTRAARQYESKIYPATAASPINEIIEGPKPYLKITDDRCRRHAVYNERTRAWEIAGVYDLNRGGCGSTIYVVVNNFEVLEIQCCPEEFWPPGAQIAERDYIMRLYAEGASHVDVKHGTHPDQLAMFEISATDEVKTRRPLSFGAQRPDEQQTRNNDGA